MTQGVRASRSWSQSSMPHRNDRRRRDGGQRLQIVPLTLRAANRFVAAHHRHHRPVRGCKFVIGCADRHGLCAVAIVGRPVARGLDDGLTFELTRLCTDKTPHAASMLVAASTRAASSMGAVRLVSYVLEGERGTSFRAAGWKLRCRKDGRPLRFGGGSWDRKSRPRDEPMAKLLGLTPRAPTSAKWRWEWRARGRAIRADLAVRAVARGSR